MNLYLFMLGYSGLKSNIATARNVFQLNPLSSEDWGHNHLSIKQSIAGNTLKITPLLSRFFFNYECYSGIHYRFMAVLIDKCGKLLTD